MSNAMAGPWDRARLPVETLSAQGEWRAGGEGLVRSLQARLGGGELQAHGEWRGTSGWAVQSRLQSVDPSALYSAMAALPLSGSADLKGEGSAIDFDLDLKAAGGKIGASANPGEPPVKWPRPCRRSNCDKAARAGAGPTAACRCLRSTFARPTPACAVRWSCGPRRAQAAAA